MTGQQKKETAFYGYHTVRRPPGAASRPAEKTRKAVEWLHANPGQAINKAAAKFGANPQSVGRLAQVEPIRHFRCPICNSRLRARQVNERKQVMNFVEWAKCLSPIE